MRSVDLSSEKGIFYPIKRFTREFKSHKGLYLMLVPGILFFVIFHYIPMYGIQIAFKDFNFYKGITGSPWVGLKHFKMLFSSTEFYRIFKNTLVINFMKMFVGVPGPIILAILLNEVRVKLYKRTLQTIYYFPHFLSWVVVGGLVFDVFGRGGLANSVVHMLGFNSISFLTSSFWFRPVLVFAAIWKAVGWNTIIYLAAISSINPQLYDAVYVDGANKFQRIWHITIPGIRSTIIILFILRMGRMMAVGFEQIFVLYSPMVYDVADVFSTYIYRTGLLEMRFSYTTAVGLFQNVVAMILLVITNRVANKMGEYGIW